MPINNNSLCKRAMSVAFLMTLSFLGILIAQQLIGINILVKRETKSVFIYQGDIVMDATSIGGENREDSVFGEQYCTYWSGFETNVFASTDIHRGKRSLDCPYIFVNR